MKRESQAPRSGSLTARNGRIPERVLGRRPTARMEFKPAWRNGVGRGRAERFRRTSRLPQSASEAFPIAKAAQAAGQRGPRELLRAASEGRRAKCNEPPARSGGRRPFRESAPGAWAMRPCGLGQPDKCRVRAVRGAVGRRPVAPGGDGEAGRAWGDEEARLP